MIIQNTPAGDLRVSKHFIERAELRCGFDVVDALSSVMKSRSATSKEIESLSRARVITAHFQYARDMGTRFFIHQDRIFVIDGSTLVTVLLIPAFIARQGHVKSGFEQNKRVKNSSSTPYKREKLNKRDYI